MGSICCTGPKEEIKEELEDDNFKGIISEALSAKRLNHINDNREEIAEIPKLDSEQEYGESIDLHFDAEEGSEDEDAEKMTVNITTKKVGTPKKFTGKKKGAKRTKFLNSNLVNKQLLL